MIDSKNFAIGVLSTTAVMLLVGLIVIQSRPAPALADGMTLVAGDYILTVGSLNQVDEDFLYVIDNSESKMIAYRFNGFRDKIEIVQGIDLEEVRRAAETKPAASNPGRRRRP